MYSHLEFYIIRQMVVPSQGWTLSTEEKIHFNRLKLRSQEEGKPLVLWGWKRDRIVGGQRQPESRTVYFSADLEENGGRVNLARAFFFLETRAKEDEVRKLKKRANGALVWSDPHFKEFARLRITMGEPTDYDNAAIARRLKGRPRISIAPPKLIAEADNYDLSSYAPFALVAGSGLSAESGLPLLGSIHNLFEVDNCETGELVFGASDRLPERIATDTEKEFRSFCQFTIDAVKAKPSESHKRIAELHRKGIIKQVFTDNMDGIFEKVNVPHVRTRHSIFPDRFPVKFDQAVKSLLAIGVAVDRRQVIKQARTAGLPVIAINPVYGVAPHSRNMDYLTRGDIFFRCTASEALPKIISASGF
jgi:hypothetical protein